MQDEEKSKPHIFSQLIVAMERKILLCFDNKEYFKSTIKELRATSGNFFSALQNEQEEMLTFYAALIGGFLLDPETWGNFELKLVSAFIVLERNHDHLHKLFLEAEKECRTPS